MTSPLRVSQPISTAVAELTGHPSDLRVGVVSEVLSFNEVAASVAGGVIHAGRLDSYLPAVGEPVVLMVHGDAWVALGRPLGSATATDYVPPTEAGMSQPASADNTASASNVVMAGTTFTARKRSPAVVTRWKITFSVSGWVSGGTTTSAFFAIRVTDGVTGVVTTTDMMPFTWNAPSTHQSAPTAVNWFAGLSAGVHTVAGMWRRTAGAGTLQRDLNDHVMINIIEIPV